jgi:hypothetical protein
MKKFHSQYSLIIFLVLLTLISLLAADLVSGLTSRAAFAWFFLGVLLIVYLLAVLFYTIELDDKNNIIEKILGKNLRSISLNDITAIKQYYPGSIKSSGRYMFQGNFAQGTFSTSRWLPFPYFTMDYKLIQGIKTQNPLVIVDPYFDNFFKFVK